jgi:hypothetical protein
MQGAFQESSSTECMNHVSRAPEVGMLGQCSDVLSQLDSYHNLRPPSAGQVVDSSSFPAKQDGNGPDPSHIPVRDERGHSIRDTLKLPRPSCGQRPPSELRRRGE